MIDINNFDAISIGLASSKQIRSWSSGEVTKPETINYRTLKPEKDGLFCERIFGPTKDWECYCGKYKRVRYKGIVCERCGVEVTRSKVRRERMGHVDLAAPVSHIWFFKGVPSRIGYLLDMAPKELEKVLYFAASIVTSIDDEARTRDLDSLEGEVQKVLDAYAAEREERVLGLQESRERRLEHLSTGSAANFSDDDHLWADTLDVDVRKLADEERAKLEKELRKTFDADIADTEAYIEDAAERMRQTWDLFRGMTPKQVVADETLFRELKDRFGSPFGFGEYFQGGMGAESVRELLEAVDLEAERIELEDQVKTAKGQKQSRAVKRLKVVSAFIHSDNKPEHMVLEAVPVIPPELRPMVQLDGGRFATSDLNDLYRRVINRNNRLGRLLSLGAPEIIVNNEKRMLQEAVDALFDNGRRGRPVTGPGNRPLKSLSDMLKGKQGRFRQNLLGKRVDYSGRSVIVAGPTLKLHQCGLPKLMALELFKPFVMKRLVDLELAQNIKTAKRMVERSRPQVWDVLEDVIKEHPVLLNRAPTLHRLGIQAFEPVLVEGKALQIHPLVCTAFNADFDGDQMAIHVPLSAEAQAEARVLMLSANNILSPASGRPIVTPTQDLVIGAFYLCEEVEGAVGEGRVFRHLWEALRAYDEGGLALHAKITMRPPSGTPYLTTVGRAMFEEALPDDYSERFGHVEGVVKKREMGVIVERLSDHYPKAAIAASLDALKNLCYRFATQSGLTVSIDDVKTPKKKQEILDGYEAQADKVESQFRRGVITDGERRQQEVRIWTDATTEVQQAMEAEFAAQRFNPIDMMVGSGARGNMTQMRQIAAMRGLVANPRGDMIPRPIKKNFREGLETLEYFIATPGARKGLVDTALRTADSGYLTRRLVDVAQELIVREQDCDTSLGIWVENVQADTPNMKAYLDTSLFGRALLKDTKLADGSVLKRGTVVGDAEMASLRDDPQVTRIQVRSVLACDAELGVCATCYGRSLATGKGIELGEAVGVIAAQSIGEPGTQLTMRTFHTGGVAGKDIAGGLPRVVELFEARTPRGAAKLARASGVVRIGEDEGKGIPVTVIGDDGEEHETILPVGARPIVADGQEVVAGELLTDGPSDPKELIDIKGIRETQNYLVEQVQKVYREQGVSIHDKHIELIVRQMTRRVGVQEPGDAGFLPGERVDAKVFRDTNRRMVEESKRPAEGRPEIMGITKASLATESWLSAASFQETTRVLTEAAIDGRGDSLIGLKENIIIGKLIPAGTGMMVYRDFDIAAPDYEPMTFYSSDAEEADPAAWLSNIHGSYDEVTTPAAVAPVATADI